MKMIITPNKFAILIEELVKTKKMSYMICYELLGVHGDSKTISDTSDNNIIRERSSYYLHTTKKLLQV